MYITLFVTNLPTAVDEDEVNGIFSAHGRVRGVNLPRDHDTNLTRGFGFVRMYDYAEGIRAAKELNDYDLLGNKLHVRKAQPQQPVQRLLDALQASEWPEFDFAVLQSEKMARFLSVLIADFQFGPPLVCTDIIREVFRLEQHEKLPDGGLGPYLAFDQDGYAVLIHIFARFHNPISICLCARVVSYDDGHIVKMIRPQKTVRFYGQSHRHPFTRVYPDGDPWTANFKEFEDRLRQMIADVE